MGSGSLECDDLAQRSRGSALSAQCMPSIDQDQRLRQRDRREQVAYAREDGLAARVRVLVAAAHLPVGRELGEPRDHRARRVAPAAAPPPALRDERGDLARRARRPSCRSPRARAPQSRRTEPPSAPACTRRARGARWAAAPQERRDERGLADAHLADDRRATDELPGAAPAADRCVVGRVQVGLLGVAADQIARAALHLGQPLLARQAPLERVEAHRRRHVELRRRRRAAGSARRPSGSRAARGGRRRRRPTCAPRRGAAEHVGDVRRGIVQRRSARGAPAGRACRWRCRARCRSTRGQRRRQIFLEAGDGLVHVERELRGVDGRARGVGGETRDGARVAVAGPHPAHAALEGEIVEHPAQLVERAPGQVRPSHAVQMQHDHGDVPYLARSLERERAAAAAASLPGTPRTTRRRLPAGRIGSPRDRPSERPARERHGGLRAGVVRAHAPRGGSMRRRRLALGSARVLGTSCGDRRLERRRVDELLLLHDGAAQRRRELASCGEALVARRRDRRAAMMRLELRRERRRRTSTAARRCPSARCRAAPRPRGLRGWGGRRGSPRG